MVWQTIIGHDAVADSFRASLQRGRLASSFLFVGPSGIGKRRFALRLAAALLCETHPAVELDPCGECQSCRQVAAATHPDLLLISRPADKTELPLSLFVGDREHRNQQGLCHDISLRPMRGQRRVAIVDDADLMSEEAANCLLKTLEEPPPGSVLILIGTSPERQLPTIRSRCQVMRFHPPAAEDAARLIAAEMGITDPREALRLAIHAGGSMERAAQLRDTELWTFRQGFLLGLADLPAASVALATRTVAFVEEVGKEAVERRARLRLVIEFGVDFFRGLMRRLSGSQASADSHGDDQLPVAVERALGSAAPWTDEQAAESLDRCLEALSQLDRNVHLSTLIECWMDDLAQLASGQSIAKVGQAIA
ncbi:MAG: DNA polymerase III subunit delta' [Planctomycetes bacterium]|nr:DNA polymerase III subunit delta' [Planctomycetota bacterium]